MASNEKSGDVSLVLQYPLRQEMGACCAVLSVGPEDDENIEWNSGSR